MRGKGQKWKETKESRIKERKMKREESCGKQKKEHKMKRKKQRGRKIRRKIKIEE